MGHVQTARHRCDLFILPRHYVADIALGSKRTSQQWRAVDNCAQFEFASQSFSVRSVNDFIYSSVLKFIDDNSNSTFLCFSRIDC